MKCPLIILSICLSQIVFAQSPYGRVDAGIIPAPTAHYQDEYNFDKPVNGAAWNNLKPGIHAAFGTTDQLYFRAEVPDVNENDTSLVLTGWRGERLNAQLVIWSADTLQQVRIMANDLKGRGNQVISKENLHVSLVRYVLSNYPYGARDATCGESSHKDVFLLPDRLEPLKSFNDRFNLPGKSSRPIWISIDIPQSTSAGIYLGTIEIKSTAQQTTLNFKINVQDQVLPVPHDWQHRLDLWQNPWVVAEVNHVVPWSNEHLLLLKKHLELYADAGGKFITTYAVHSPWSDNSYHVEGGMIDWIKQKDGTWKFDYKIFDQYVQLAMSVGIDKAITIYTPVPWGFRFRFLDEKTGNYMYESWAPTSNEFQKHWNIFLTDLRKHLQQKGWFNKTYLGINENAMEETLAAINVIKAHSKDWRITYAGDWHPELENLLDDYCFLFGKESDVDVVKRRAAKGLTTTYYVCCNPPYPNNFLFSPPIEGRWMGWYTTAHNYSGFLRWAYDAWPADPTRNANHIFWPAGDCFLVYPGGYSCIRFEKMREGIVDFEKIRILRDKVAHTTGRKATDLLKQLDQQLSIILSEKEFDTKKITSDVMKGRDIVEQLSDALVYKVKGF